MNLKGRDYEGVDWFQVATNRVQSVQTSTEAHTASYPMGTVGPFPGRKERPGRHTDHSLSSNAEVMNE
jgi:hypothetical protein